MRVAQCAVLSIPFLLGSLADGRAQEYFDWDNGIGTNNWFDSENWVDGVVPEQAPPPKFNEHVVRLNTEAPHHAIIGMPGAETDVLHIGTGSGKGELTIENGGTLDVGFETELARGSTSMATMLLTGAGSQLMTSNVLIGRRGQAILTIENGGTVATGNTTIGSSSTGNGTLIITGAGSSFTATGSVFNLGDGGTGVVHVAQGGLLDASGGTRTQYMGWAGSGTLTIESGGTALTSEVWMGLEQTATAAATISGPGSKWIIGGDLTSAFRGSADVTIADAGLVEIDSGSGTIEMAVRSAASSSLTIGAAAGDPAAAPGSLSAAGVQLGAGTSALVFNHTDMSGAYAFAPDIISGAGAASLDHHAGYTDLTGDNSGFTGPTTIHGGMLAVNNMLGGSVAVMDGGALGGSGQISGPVTIAGGGMLAPGNSIGTLTVSGATTLESGSTFAVEIDNQGNSDLLNSADTVEIQSNVTLAITPQNGTSYGVSTQYTVITAENGLSGAFDTITDPFLFLDAMASYDAQNAYLTLNRNGVGFTEVAATQNQMSVAEGLEDLDILHPLVTALLQSVSQEDTRNSLDQLSGEAHSSLKGALIENGQETVKAINDRIHAAFDADAANTSIAAYGSIADPAGGFWLTGFGDWMTTDSTGNTAQMDNTLGGVLAGIDRRVGAYGRVGVLGGYANTSTSVQALASQADADSYTVGLYGGADNEQAAFNIGALYTWHSIDSTRTVTNPVAETLSADYNARSLLLFAEAGYRVTRDRITIEPFAGVSYVNLQTDAFSETGGAAALTSSSETTDTTFTTLGLRSSIFLSPMVSTRAMVGWRHAFGDLDPSSTFTIAGSNPFTILGAPVAQDAAVVEAGFDIQAGDNVTIAAFYEGQYGDGTIANGFNARLLAQF